MKTDIHQEANPITGEISAWRKDRHEQYLREQKETHKHVFDEFGLCFECDKRK
jgi:hypothetical protein